MGRARAMGRTRAMATYRPVRHMCNFRAKFVREVVRRLHLRPFRYYVVYFV